MLVQRMPGHHSTASVSSSAPDSLAISMDTFSPCRPGQVVGRRVRAPPVARSGSGPGASWAAVPPGIGVHDLADQPVPDHVGAGQPREVYVLHPVQDLLDHPQAAARAAGRSTWVTSPVTTILAPNPSRAEHLHPLGVVFCRLARMMNASLSVRPRM